ncbi:MAG: hypothetical protein A2Y07_10015 [Planctomycetes bacterium GWF2_50_10]|nr:MAG: hypothetical protein A2Y07_10015 [Planctomycetes bacterium GWF2_50_10]
MVNPFSIGGKWFKANLHAHTTTSDGDTVLAERIRQYRDKGYDVLAITDHDTTNDLTGFSDKDFLVMQGMETHPPCPFGGDLYHLVCLNIPQRMPFSLKADAETRVSLIKHGGGIVILAHPYWCGYNINHMLAIDGYCAIEVFNATSTKNGKAYSSVHWDSLLAAGRMVGAVASDDCHRGRDMFMGYTMIKAAALTSQDIIEALSSGAYYASTGGVIEDFGINGFNATIRCQPAMEIHFISRRSTGRSFYAESADKPLTSAECELSALDRYVRAEIVDVNGNRAWANPIVLR